jgi:putative sigma-54 modulation protein
MQITVQSKTIPVTDALRAFAERHLGKLLKSSSRVGHVTVFLEKVAKKKNDVQAAIARVKIDLPGREVVVERRSWDLYDAISQVSDRAQRAVRKLKERRQTLKRSLRGEAEYLPVLP